MSDRGTSLNWLFDGIATLPRNEARVEDLTLDSREVRAGSLFFALRGSHSHGVSFAVDAAARGASVVLWEAVGPEGAPAESAAAPECPALGPTVFAAPVVGLRKLLGRIADRFFGRPSAHLRVVGITGTNGKTTCAYLLAQCLQRLGSDAAYIGTLGAGRLASLVPPTHTTPDVISMHRTLGQLRAAGVRDVALEVSSHALDQGRVDGVRFHSAAFTNLTRDHLDYHGSMQAYGAAKARLFQIPDLERIIVNVGDAFGRDLARGARSRVSLTAVWLGTTDSDWSTVSSLYVRDVTLNLKGLSMTLGGSFGESNVATRLLGRFNAENCVVVLACLLALGITLIDAERALALCHAPPGRMEVIESPSPDKPVVVIDYAHTPDALAKALAALKEHCRGALWLVFGCGGDRDPGKRPMMGAIADDVADRIIVTDDNPRTEDPEEITSAITAAIFRHSTRTIHERSEAIAAALNEAVAGDMVLIAGKGHEDYQICGTARRDFSDRREALRWLGAAA